MLHLLCIICNPIGHVIGSANIDNLPMFTENQFPMLTRWTQMVKHYDVAPVKVISEMEDVSLVPELLGPIVI